MTTNDVRKGFRIEVRIPTQVHLDSRKVDGEILNLSEGGAFVQCPADWKVGQTVTLEIQFSGKVVLAGTATSWEELRGKAIHGTAPQKSAAGPIPQLPMQMDTQTVIRWTLQDENAKAPQGFGVEFTQLGAVDRDVLKRILRYYEILAKAGVQFG
jgi:Tfp pilus assembly protein PilZ